MKIKPRSINKLEDGCITFINSEKYADEFLKNYNEKKVSNITIVTTKEIKEKLNIDKEFIICEYPRLTFAETVNVFVIVMAFVAYLIASAGLLLYKGWGRWLYLYSTIVGFVVGPLLGTTINPPFAGTLDDLCTALIGVTIGITPKH